MRTTNVWKTILMLLTLCGCTASGPSYLASEFVKSQLIRASEGGTITVQAIDSATLAGVTVVIPPGALSADTRITIGYGAGAGAANEWNASPSPTASVMTQGAQPAGPVVYLGPDGTAFRVPVTVTLPFAHPQGGQGNQLAIYALENGGQTYTLPNGALRGDLQMSAGFVTFNVNGFTQFQPGDYIPPPPDAGCLPGLSVCPDGDGGILCADTTSDPNNCGSCGYVCPQSLCAGSNCYIDGGTPNDAGVDAGTGVDGGPDAGACGELVDNFGGFSNTADVLIVIDTSAGESGLTVLAQHIGGLIDALERDNVDYQVGVTTTGFTASTDGQLLPCPGCKVDGGTPLLITPSDPNAASDLTEFVLLGGDFPAISDAGPQFFQAASRALDGELAYNQGFVRSGARTLVLAVSGYATDDQSPGMVDSYVQTFLLLESRGSAGVAGFQFDYLSPSGLAVDGGYVVDNSLLPPRLSAMMDSSLGGLAIDSLGVNFELGFQVMVDDLTPVILPLSSVPDPSTINVYLDGPPPDRVQPGQTPGVQILSTNPNSSTNWTYDPVANAIQLNGADLTVSGSDTIYVEYTTAAACPGVDGGGVCGSAAVWGNSIQYPIPVAYSTPTAPWRFVTADFNQDGIQDMVMSSGAIYYGLSDGGVELGATVINDSWAWGLTVADLNGDGWPDVVTAHCELGGVVNLWMNQHDGTFAGYSLPLLDGVTCTQGIGIADLDGDGLVDLAVCGPSGVQVYFNDGGVLVDAGGAPGFNGPFAHTTDNCWDITAAQFSDAGMGALAYVDVTTGTLSFVQGVGQIGDALHRAFAPNNGAILSSGQVLAADLNNDGLLDLIVSGGPITVFINIDGGTFADGVQTAQIAGTWIDHIAVADLNGDGFLDILGAALNANCDQVDTGSTTQVLYNDCTGAFPWSVAMDAGAASVQAVGALQPATGSQPGIVTGNFCTGDIFIVPANPADGSGSTTNGCNPYQVPILGGACCWPLVGEGPCGSTGSAGCCAGLTCDSSGTICLPSPDAG